MPNPQGIMMNIKFFKLTTVTFFTLIGCASFGMQPEAPKPTLEIATSSTHFNQFEPNELRLLASTCASVRKKALEKKTEYWTALQGIGLRLFNTYRNNKYLHPDCIFANCMYKRKYDEVGWLLKNKTIYPLFISDQKYPWIINCDTSELRNDNRLMDAILIEQIATTEAAHSLSYYSLIIEGACMGNRSITREYCDHFLDFDTMNLLICAGIKNKDADFLKELYNFHKNFAKYMSLHRDHFLYFICTGHAFQPDNPTIDTLDTKIHCPTIEDITFFKELINSGCFKPTIKLLDHLVKLNNQEQNLHIFDEMIETLHNTPRIYCTLFLTPTMNFLETKIKTYLLK